MRTLPLAALSFLPLLLSPCHSQTPTTMPATTTFPSIGSVATTDATLSGDLILADGRATLIGSSTVFAGSQTAAVTLRRGGELLVCTTSTLHLAQGRGTGTQPLMLSLDRGAIELRTTSAPNDLLLTPDLRFTLRSAGPVDLRLRVTRNGDTCVENLGAGAPLLGITDQFGDSTYELHPNQHVLFEHGSLKEVVDHESSPCGCPPASPQPPAITVAATPAAQAAAANPFPAAVSEGLAPAPPVPQAAPGVAHAQVASTLGYAGDGSGTISGTPVAAPVVTPPAPVAARPLNRGLGHRIGRFFKRIFG